MGHRVGAGEQGPGWGLPALQLGRGGGFLLNHSDQKLFTSTSFGYKVNHFLYYSFQSVILCKERRKRNETYEQNRCYLLLSKHIWKIHYIKKNRDFQKQNHLDFFLQIILLRPKMPDWF